MTAIRKDGADLATHDRRPLRRARTLLPAIATYANGIYSFDCTIRDLSETGARIAIPKGLLFPSEFHLINVSARTVHEAKVVWCGATQAGVRFVRTVALSKITDPSLGFLKRLWLERAAR